MGSLFIGERVEAARVKAGWTQHQLAEKSGLTRQTIANIENGRTRVYVEYIIAIAKAVDKPPSWFLEDGD